MNAFWLEDFSFLFKFCQSVGNSAKVFNPLPEDLSIEALFFYIFIQLQIFMIWFITKKKPKSKHLKRVSHKSELHTIS